MTSNGPFFTVWDQVWHPHKTIKYFIYIWIFRLLKWWWGENRLWTRYQHSL
jgi:hypothetical protein